MNWCMIFSFKNINNAFLTRVSGPKLLKLRPMSFHNFALTNLFVIEPFDFQPFYKGVIKCLRNHKKWHRHTHIHTDEHCDLDTELARWADALKILVRPICICDKEIS